MLVCTQRQFHKLRTMSSCWLKGSHGHNILTSVSTLTTCSMLRSGQTPKSRVGLHSVSVPQAANHGQLLAERFTQSQHPHIRFHSHHLQHVAIRTDAKVPCLHSVSVPQASNHGQLLAERFTQSQHPHIRFHSHHLQHVAIRIDAKVPCWSALSVSSTSLEPWTVVG